MKKLSAIFAALFLCLLCHTASAANIKDFPRVAVMNFGNKAVMSQGLRDTDFSAATEYAIYQLSACGWFDLIDYEELSTIAKMHSVNMSGLIDPSTAPAVGKVLGAQFMVVGNLTGLTTKENTVGYQHGNKGSLGVDEHVVTANVSMRIVDVETGRIVVAGLGKGSSTSTKTEIVFKKYRRKRVDTETTTVNENVQTNTSYTGNVPMESGGDGYDGEATGDLSYSGAPLTANDDYYNAGAVAGDTGTNTATTTASGSYQWTQNTSYEDEELDYKITIGTVEVSDIQVRNAISKAIRDCVYGNTGLMTTLNGGKKLKIKTGL